MAEILKFITLESINVRQNTDLSLDASADQKIIKVSDFSGLASDDILIVGLQGKEQSELVYIDSVSEQDITLLANLNYKHYRNEPVKKLAFDKIKIYRADNINGSVPSDLDFTVLATIDIQADKLEQIYIDALGGSNYWYKKTYLNSITSEEIDLSEAVAVRGGNDSHYCTVDEIRIEAGLSNNFNITDDTIYQKLLAAQSEINSSLAVAGTPLPLTQVPATIKQICLWLAAGLILIMDYGVEYTGMAKDGERKIKLAREKLKLIENSKITLVQDDGSTVQKTSQVRYYPNESQDDAGPRYKMSDVW